VKMWRLVVCLCVALFLPFALCATDFVEVAGVGKVHPSCLHFAQSGSIIQFNSRNEISHFVDSKNEHRIVPKCEHSLFSVSPSSNKSLAPEIPAYAYWKAGNFLTEYTAKWKVPSAPKTSNGQVISLSTFVQNVFVPGNPLPVPGTGISSEKEKGFATDADSILASLQYGKSRIGGGDFWSITVAYVSASGTVIVIPPVQVSTNDTVASSFFTVGTDTNKWTASLTDLSVPHLNVSLVANTTYEPYAFVALDFNGVTDCSQLPEGQVDYTSITLKATGNPIKPTWIPKVTDERCDIGIKVVSMSAITVYF